MWRMSTIGRSGRGMPERLREGLALVLTGGPLATNPRMRDGELQRRRMMRNFTRTTGIKASITASHSNGRRIVWGHRTSIYASGGTGGSSVIVIMHVGSTIIRNEPSVRSKVVGGGRVEALVQPPPDVPGGSGSWLSRAGQAERSRNADGITRASDTP